MNNKILKALSAVFVFVFLLLSVTAFVHPALTDDKEYSETENRYLASFPELSFQSVLSGEFMSAFESYLSDHFSFRDKIVSVKTMISRALGKTEINDVYIGKDNRLFEVPSEYDSVKTDNIINAVNSFAESCGIENQYFLLAPNSSYVHASYLPSQLKTENQRDIIDGIYSRLADRINTVDVCLPLINQNDELLYFRTDHHWTHKGAFYAFSELAREMNIETADIEYDEICLSNSFSGTLASSSGINEATDTLSALLPSDSLGKYYVQNFSTQEKSASVFDTEKLNQKNQYEVFFGGNFGRIAIHTDNMNEQYLLVIKDSFANSLIPLLIPHFEKIVIIDPRYFTDDINNILEDDNYTHLLYLYNLNTLLEDTVLKDAIS